MMKKMTKNMKKINNIQLYNKQQTIELYRKWFMIGKKDPNNYYDKEQIDDLYILIKTEIGVFINQFIEEKRFAYKATLPFIYVHNKSYIKFDVQVLVNNKYIYCMSLPGCCAEGITIEEAFNNLILAVIQCADVRIRNNLGLWTMVYTMNLWHNPGLIESKELIKKFLSSGWTNIYVGPYHTVMRSDVSEVTYTIINDGMISNGLHYAYDVLRFLISRKKYNELYGVGGIWEV